jgi:methanethiol S-methyltransferase
MSGSGCHFRSFGFVGNLWVPKSIDSAREVPLGLALLTDALLLTAFAIQHSVMARPAFKRWWTRIIPASAERSTYILFASVALIALYMYWELFGLRQVWLQLRRKPYEPLPFGIPVFYRYVRHPLYLGLLLAFWSTPTMTLTHLVFAIATTLYILIAIQLEERDLIAEHSEYALYRRRVPMLVPFLKGR